MQSFFRSFPLTLLNLFVAFSTLTGLPVNVSAASEKIVLQLRWDHQFQFAGYYAAKWQGYYQEEGLDVEIRPATTPQKILSTVQEVSEGRAHFGIGGADILKAKDEGADLYVVASIFQHSGAGFYTKKATVISSPADFLKLKVARRVNDLIDVELQAMLKAEGIDPTKLKSYPHQPGIDHLVSGMVDVVPGYTLNIPYTAHAQNIAINEIRPVEYGIDFYGDSIFTNKNMVANHPDTVTRFKKASIKGWQYALENRDAMVQDISSQLSRIIPVVNITDFNTYQSQKVNDLISYPDVEIGHINPSRWERMHHYLLTLGILKNTIDIDSFIFDPEKTEQLAAEKRQRLLVLFSTIGLCALLLFAVWTYSLRSAVQRKTRELSLANKKLSESEKNYRELIEFAQEGIWVIDKDGKTTFVNPSMAKMLGYTPEEMKDKHLFSFTDEAGAQNATKCLHRRQQGIAEQHDFEFLRKDGERVFVTLATTPIIDAQNTYQGAIAGIIDITQRRKAEQEQLRLQHHLLQAQKIEEIGNLAGGIAHDFNNMISLIIGFTELALDDAVKGSPQEDCLEEVNAAAKRAKDMVAQILAFARQSDEEKESVEVGHVVLETLKLLRPATPSTITIEERIQSSSCVMANRAQLHQVFINLCTNANHAMQATGGTLTIQLHDVVLGDEGEKNWTLEHGRYVEAIISDTGAGIPPSIIDSIFDPYFTTKGVGQGTGMGLAMVKGIIEKHGGEIQVLSTPGEGSAFTFRLPVSSTESGTTEYTADKDLPHGDERIFLIDDELSIISMGSRMLEGLGYSVTTQASSVEALELFRSNPMAYDLILTDMVMPHMNGDQLTIKMREIRPDIPVIISTGYSNSITEEISTKLGIHAFLFKPVSKKDYAWTVRDVLDRKD